jgi:hypothetical protein
MNQRQAVDVVESLLPLMKGKDPSEVFVKYAAERHLSPAQLERLGQVFNTASTLYSMEKSATEIPHLIDVPEMVASYVQTTGRRMKAAADTPAVESPSRFRPVPDVWGMQKAAEQTAPPPSTDSRRTVSDLTFYKRAVDATTIALHEAQKRMDLFSRQSTAILTTLKKLEPEEMAKTAAILQQDMTNIDPSADAFAAHLINSFKEANIPVSLPQVRNVAIARDRTGLLGDALQAFATMKSASEAWDALDTSLTALASIWPKVNDDIRVREKVARLVGEVRRADVWGLLKLAKPAKKPEGSDTPFRDLNSDMSQVNFRQSMGDRVKLIEGELAKLDDSSTQNPDVPAMFVAGSGLVPLAAGAGLNQIRRTVFDDAPSIVKQFTPEGDIGRYMQRQYGNDNRRKALEDGMDLRQIREDTEAMATLQSLMITDDILATKDPARVFEAFQTIRRASPQVASDPSMLRLLLRQALETQGVDIDTGTAVRKYEFGSYRANPEWKRLIPSQKHEDE